ncbi:MAG: prepilin-type N-terminal cleavage/methylation domain-containing protein [Desulfobulbaceae bacterium]|nr:prepilin-type N-terminal cleavage/methylation domain-containing protein [Desulfobulbaceae bacterium]
MKALLEQQASSPSCINSLSLINCCRHPQGFTLMEVAIVLVIVGLLSGGGITILSSQLELRRVRQTKVLLDEVREALIGFAVSQGRLPRPATSATVGAENPVACTSEALCTGFIPWSTLGVAKLDGFDKIIRYSVTPAFAGGGTGTALIDLSTSVATKTVQTRDGAGALTYQAGQLLCSMTSQCMPAVIFSHGKKNYGTGENGNVMADNSATNSDEDTNDSASFNFISRTPSNNTTFPGGEFDDLIIWLSPNILFNRMVAAGKLP